MYFSVAVLLDAAESFRISDATTGAAAEITDVVAGSIRVPFYVRKLKMAYPKKKYSCFLIDSLNLKKTVMSIIISESGSVRTDNCSPNVSKLSSSEKSIITDDEVIPSLDIEVTTVTTHTHLRSKINLLSLSHYLEHFQSDWPEIVKVTSNFGRQVMPTKKRIFYFATWIGIRSDVTRPHKLCIRFNGNGAIHVVGIINPSIERPLLAKWLGKFLRAVHESQVPCKHSITQRETCHNLWACDEGYIWSPSMKWPIGWSPKVKDTDDHGDKLVLSGKPVTTVMDHHKIKFKTLKGNPTLYFDQYGHLVDTNHDTSIKFPVNDDWNNSIYSIDDVASLSTTKLDFDNLNLEWVTDCINAKCDKETVRAPTSSAKTIKNINWLDRDLFKEFVKTNYPSLMVSFDPEVHKAVQITFFPDKPNCAGRFEQRGSVSVSGTGLFWLYGFSQMQFANDTAEMIRDLVRVFKSSTSTNLCE